jgi:2-dehydro-3-deoxyphosphogluconate aldolase/(4S)-4-hydroxy-2-oxoglutarate aldolase
MLVGAGTVLTTEQVDKAAAAGAKFIVSPGLNETVVKYCIEKGVPVIPGCATPSEVEAAIALGLDTVKFFPAEAAGGLDMIKAMSAPYTNVKFMPTGGINTKNLNEYLANDEIAACGGSWMVDKKYINAGDYKTIEALAREAVTLMLGLKLKHVGINAKDEADAKNITGIFAGLLDLPVTDIGKAFFVGEPIEVMKNPSEGANGHIAISANNVARAVYHLEKRGLKFNKESALYNDKGAMRFIYLKDEIGGFAVHLTQK